MQSFSSSVVLRFHGFAFINLRTPDNNYDKYYQILVGSRFGILITNYSGALFRVNTEFLIPARHLLTITGFRELC